ncbi:peptidyl-tRNA hydrolase PTH2-domain-containing protein [Roridomyces roridus]|uniref:peptidyl-tRNA hydrolase n=1 Tax=Roridomyces roridus TaxID=1738132 RepID=A0AAD7BUA6_9AGAR|nr:peptidyl-tRNA hydrolase PTH2-domain-containing protein [Roridomyces roridus]
MSLVRLGAPGIALALSIVSASFGYYLGRSTPTKNIVQEDEPEDEPTDDGDLSAVTAGTFEPCKLVLIVRTDLKMTPGKISSQHATLACYRALVQRNTNLVRHWERTGQAKIALKATSEKQLLDLQSVAKNLNLCARCVQDQGTTTVLAIGPAPVEVVNRVTGKLRLL